MQRYTTPALTARLKKAWRAVFPADASRPSLLRKARVLCSLQVAERGRQRLLDRVVRDLTADLVREVQDGEIDAVGFKLWNGDGVAGAAAMARALKQACPEVRVFGGGPHVDMFMNMILEHFAGFDAAAYGEGEETIRLLAEQGGDPRAYSGIPNLLYRDNGEVRQTAARLVDDLDALPLPVYDPDVYPAMRGDEKLKLIVLDESRGCGNHCAFCIHPVKSHHRQRVKSIPRLMQELDALHDRHGLTTFRFAGSCTPYTLLNAFAAEVVAQDRDIAYTSFAHVRESARANFRQLKQSGCRSLFFGVESGSQRLLDAMRKGIKLTATETALNGARDAGIFTVGSLIYPAPGEDDASTQETLSLVKRLRPDAVVVQPPLVMPRTDWFDDPQRYGIAFHDRAAYLETALLWKAKPFLPTAFWSPAPVSVDGRSFRKMLGVTMRFARQLEDVGFPVAISDDTYLMGDCLDRDVVEFRNQTREAFYTGDTPVVQALVNELNRRVQQRAPRAGGS
jgi:radical SAM superfamily enzyme YgiQ (UPF0313 family)